MDEKDTDFCSLPHKEWCDLLSTLETKDNMKKYAAQIKRLDRYKVVFVDSERDTILKVPHKKKARTSVFPDHKQSNKKNTPRHGGIQRYCVLYKKTGITEHKYMSRSAET